MEYESVNPVRSRAAGGLEVDNLASTEAGGLLVFLLVAI